MVLFQQMNEALKSAMRGGRKDEVGIYRMLISEVKKLAIDRKARDEIDDDLVIEALTKAKKTRLESVDQYRKGDREDLAAKEEAEIAMIQTYLPAAISAEELAALVDEAVAESGAQTPKEMGKVMKIVMPKVTGRADGKEVQRLVLDRLKG